MSVLRVPNNYTPLPPQLAFRRSKAKVKAYGGAVAGGKSYAICQEAFDNCLEFPGIVQPIFRQKHTAITLSTRRTFMEQVLPSELRGRKDLVRTKESQGDDFVEFWNGSMIHFAGLDDPLKWFSSELGAVAFDEAHEMNEEDVVTIMSRLRQRCKKCGQAGLSWCPHMPRNVLIAFNPMPPSHWLYEWFILGSTRTEFGYRKDELMPTDAASSIGTAEFFVSRPADNPHLPPGYIEETLAGMPEWMRRRYLDGLWEYTGGQSIFDQEALSNAKQAADEFKPLLLAAEPHGDLTGKDQDEKPRVKEQKNGRLQVYKAPARWHVTDDGVEHQAHRYVVSVDASSGASADFSAVQVIDIEELEQVAEWQGKVDPDKLAEVAFLLACVYNGAMLAPETTGGWGFAVVQRCKAMIGKWEGSPKSKPTLFTRPIMDRLSQSFTDVVGWDTNTKTRAQMLDTLEQTLRDGSLTVHGDRTLIEMGAFAFPERPGNQGDYRSPRAMKGAHDDLVIALAIGVFVALRHSRQVRRQTTETYEPMFEAAGY